MPDRAQRTALDHDGAVTTRTPRPLRLPVALVAALAAAALLAGSCSDPAAETGDAADADEDAPEPGGAAAAAEPAELEGAACVDPAAVTVGDGRITCEVLVLPEDPELPDGRQVELPVLRIRPSDTSGGTAAVPGGVDRTEPVIVLHGGPGASAVDDWATWWSRVDELGRELVLYDQRGAGAATPALGCPERDAAVLDVLGTTDGWPEERSRVAEAVARCHDRLRGIGVDLDQFDTAASVRDLEQLRRALGADRPTLLASSAGTRLALAYTVEHPEHVGSLALGGVDLPGTGGPRRERDLVDAAIERLDRACGDDPACGDAGLGPADALDDAAAIVDQDPLVIDLAASDLLEQGATLRVTGNDLVAAVVAAMYDTLTIPALPGLLRALAAGAPVPAEVVADRVVTTLVGGAFGTTMSVNCADHGIAALSDPDERALVDEDPDRAATVLLTGSDGFCTEWDIEPDTIDADRLLDGPAPEGGWPPTLIVAGELDPITPAADARRLAGAIEGATYLEVPRGGHDPMLTDPSATSALASFLADPLAPDTSCAAIAEPLPFS